MGIYDRDYSHANYRGSGGQQFRLSMPPVTPIVLYLLIANLAIFFLSALIPPLRDLIKGLFAVEPKNWFTSIQVWRLIGYQFLHADFMHVFFNMYALYIFGPEIEHRFGRNKFIIFYLVCGATGGALYTLLATIGVLVPAPMVGASGAILGLIAANAILTPDRQIRILFFFTMTYRILAIILVAIFTFFFFFGKNAGGDLAHLSGMATAAIYLKWKPWQIGAVQKTRRIKWEHKLNQERNMQADVDKILDKISKHGIGSLSRQERKILKQASQKQQEQERNR